MCQTPKRWLERVGAAAINCGRKRMCRSDLCHNLLVLKDHAVLAFGRRLCVQAMHGDVGRVLQATTGLGARGWFPSF